VLYNTYTALLRCRITPRVGGRENKILRATSWWGFDHHLKAQKITQDGCREAGVLPNPEFTPRNTTTRVFGFWGLAGPKDPGPVLEYFIRLSTHAWPVSTYTRRCTRAREHAQTPSRIHTVTRTHINTRFDLITSMGRNYLAVYTQLCSMKPRLFLTQAPGQHTRSRP